LKISQAHIVQPFLVAVLDFTVLVCRRYDHPNGMARPLTWPCPAHARDGQSTTDVYI